MLRKTHFEFDGISNTLAQKEKRQEVQVRGRLIGTRSVTCKRVKQKEHLRDAEFKSAKNLQIYKFENNVPQHKIFSL